MAPTTAPPHPTFAPYAALLFNAMFYGLAWWPFQTMRAAGLAAPWATLLMYVVLVLSFSLFSAQSWRELVRYKELWLLSAVAGLTNVSFNTAVSTGDVVRVILLFYLMPAWAVLLAWRFLGERPSPAALLRLLLAFGGMVMVIVPDGADWRHLLQGLAVPDLLALLGGLGFAAINVILRHPSKAPARVRMLSMFVGCTVVGLLSSLLGVGLGWLPGLPQVQTVWVVLVLVMAVFVALANWTLQYGAARLPTATTSLMLLSEVLFASVSAWLLGATVLTPSMLLGGALIVLAALLAALQARKQTA